jgi:hypothetical protein
MVVAEAKGFMVAAEAEASMVAAEAFTAADLMAASGLLVEEGTIRAAASVVGQGVVRAERAADRMAGPKRAAVLAQGEVVRRMFVRRMFVRQSFVRQSMMASGIRSATLVVPRV